MASEAPSNSTPTPKPRRSSRVRRAFVAAPCGWRAVFIEPDGKIEERPVACFVVVGQGNATEAMPMTSYAGAVYEVDSGDYRGMIGPGQTSEVMLAEWRAGEERYAEHERKRQEEEAARSTPEKTADGGGM